MIYLDNAATTAVKQEILDTYNELNRSFFANPSSPHRLGKEVDVLLLQAKKNILSTFNLNNHRVIFTSGATEANNMFLKGAYLNYK
jgi:cysteine desulfurase